MMHPTRFAPRPAWILIGMIGIYFFAFFQRVAVPGTLFEALQRDFAASAGAVAGLSAVYLYLYGGMQVVAGLLADRMGAAREILIGGLLLAAGSLLFPLAVSMPWLYAARALIGVGASLVYICLIKVAADLFAPRRFAMLVGLVLFLGYAGGLAGTYPFERLTALVGWRRALLGVGAATAAAVLVSAVLLQAARMLRAPEGVPAGLMLGAVLRNRACWPNLGMAPLQFPVYFVIQMTIGIKFLRDVCGISSAAAAGVSFLMMLTTMCAALVGGVVLRACGYRHVPIMRASLACTTAGVALLGMGIVRQWGAAWFLAAFLILALASLSSAAGTSLIKNLNDPRAMGTAIGLVNGGVYLGVAVMANVAGLILDHFQPQAVIVAGVLRYPKAAYLGVVWMCLAACALAWGCALRLQEAVTQRPGLPAPSAGAPPPAT